MGNLLGTRAVANGSYIYSFPSLTCTVHWADNQNPSLLNKLRGLLCLEMNICNYKVLHKEHSQSRTS